VTWTNAIWRPSGSLPVCDPHGPFVTIARRTVSHADRTASCVDDGRMAKRTKARPRTSCCLYCARPWTPGVVSKSKEHPLGDWRRKLEENHSPEQRIYKAVVGYDEAANELVEYQSQIVFKKAALLTPHTREVCEDCNTGWMSSLQAMPWTSA
jgi:hypothetical protein